jgi:hypothetical protein
LVGADPSFRRIFQKTACPPNEKCVTRLTPLGPMRLTKMAKSDVAGELRSASAQQAQIGHFG